MISTSARNAGAEALYRENFPATSGMTPFSTFGWSAYYGNASTNATVATAGSTGNPANAQVSGGPSAPTPGPNVNAGTSSQTAIGFVPLLTQDGVQDFFIFTNEFTIDRTTSDPGSFSWYAGSYYAGDTQRLAIQIGGVWYASNNTVEPVAFGTLNGGQGFGPAAQQFVSSFSTAASTWKTLNFTPGSPLTLGADLASPLPGGSISGFGVFAQIDDHAGSSDERTFFDTFEANPVPEPTIVSPVGLASSSLLFTRRRRQA